MVWAECSNVSDDLEANERITDVRWLVTCTQVGHALTETGAGLQTCD